MKRGALRPVIVALVAALALVPAASRGQSDLEARLARVERLLDGGVLVQMLEEIEALRAEVQGLRGEIEVHSKTVSHLEARQRDLYLGLDQRLLRLEVPGADTASADAASEPDTPALAGTEPESEAPAGEERETLSIAVFPPAGASVATEATDTAQSADPVPESLAEVESGGPEPVGDGAAAGEGVAEVDPIREQQDYQAAFNLLKSGRYDDATKAFRNFLVAYPGGEFVDNAHYWLGETYYVTRHFEAALQEFEGLIAHYPQSPKLTHAMLKVGYIHHELGRLEQAKQALIALTESHPDSTAAGLARKRLQRLQSE
jgi:tol-pal system protein YbgF